MTQEEIDALINSGNVEADPASVFEATAFSPQFQEFGSVDKRSPSDLTNEEARLAMLYDLQLPVSIELAAPICLFAIFLNLVAVRL